MAMMWNNTITYNNIVYCNHSCIESLILCDWKRWKAWTCHRTVKWTWLHFGGLPWPRHTSALAIVLQSFGLDHVLCSAMLGIARRQRSIRLANTSPSFDPFEVTGPSLRSQSLTTTGPWPTWIWEWILLALAPDVAGAAPWRPTSVARRWHMQRWVTECNRQNYCNTM